MGRQINYYMDLESYKLLVQKALKLGFKVVVEDKKDIKIYDSIDNIEFKQMGMYYVKKLAPYTEIEMKSSNPRCNCRTYITKEYITPVFLEMIKSGGYSCT